VLATTPRWVVGVNVAWTALTVAAPLLHAALAVGVVDAVVGSRCTLASPTAGQGGASAGVASSVPGPLALCALALCGVAVVPAVCQVALLASGTGCGQGHGVVGAGALAAVAVALGYPAASAAAMAHGAGAQKRVASFGRALAACSVVPSLTSVLVGQRPVRPVARVGLWTLSLGAAMSVALWLTLVTGAVSGQLANGGLGIGLTLPVQTAADCTLVSLRGARWLAVAVLTSGLLCGSLSGLAFALSVAVARKHARLRYRSTAESGAAQASERLLADSPQPWEAGDAVSPSLHVHRAEAVVRGGVVVRGDIESEFSLPRTALQVHSTLDTQTHVFELLAALPHPARDSFPLRLSSGLTARAHGTLVPAMVLPGAVEGPSAVDVGSALHSPTRTSRRSLHPALPSFAYQDTVISTHSSAEGT
jgi:hypothetical protein